jgi:hypothetical protein
VHHGCAVLGVPAMRTIQLTTLVGMLIAVGIFTASAESNLSKYANKYPSERVGGRSFLNAIEKSFVSVFGTEKWKRFASYSTESPITVENGAFGTTLLSHRCMRHNCYSENAFIVVEAMTGRIVMGCFNRATEKGNDINRDVEWVGVESGGRLWSLHIRGPQYESQLDRGAKRYLVRCEEEDWGVVHQDMFGPE